MKVIKEYSSEEVIEGLQKKDKEVFRFLFEKYFGQLVHFAEYFLPYSVHFLVPTIAIEFEFNNS